MLCLEFKDETSPTVGFAKNGRHSHNHIAKQQADAKLPISTEEGQNIRYTVM